MVFSALLAQVANPFLSKYIEGLDSSKLNVGLLGGDVVLRDLEIKATALDDLDLPVKLKSGTLGELVLKVPWTNLYAAPTIANVSDLHLLVVPNKGIVYDGAKEAANSAATKGKELEALEAARTLRRKGPQEPQQEGMVEGLIAAIIKNLQVNISNIHIRLEDEYTNRDVPFAAGATLSSLSFQTTDENWDPKIFGKEVISLFYKAVALDSLSVYWNTAPALVSRLKDKAEIKTALKASVASDGKPLERCNYILRPLSISARLKLNLKPEKDGTNWQTPKVDLSVDVPELGLNLGKFQYQNLLEFLEGQERFNLSARYRKYRPNLNEYRGHYAEWWKFAISAVLEEDVKRRSRNWSWEHIKAHRKLGREYKAAWVQFLTVRSPPKAVTDKVAEAEKAMDVFNLNVLRQQAELEVDRRKLTRVADQKQGWGAWAASWLGGGGGSQPTHKDGSKDIASQFNEAMTPEERAKLFEAIDYQENQLPTSYPKEYVEFKVGFVLRKLLLTVRDEEMLEKRVKPKADVVRLELDTVSSDMAYRSAAKGLSLGVAMEKLAVTGMNMGKAVPPVIVQMATKTTPLLKVEVETNPLDGSCDSSVKLRAQPLNVIYHAPSVNKLAEVFKPPESVRLSQISAAAMAKYETVKAQSTTGLAHAVQKRSKLLLDIAFQPTLLMIPETGVYTKNSHLLLVDLGALSLRTIDDSKSFNFKGDRHLPADKKLADVHEKAYDNFLIELRSLQILLAGPKEDWMGARRKSAGPLHVLNPTGFQLLFRKSGVDDAHIPKLQLLGNLPNLELEFSEARLLELAKLAVSIPLPEPGPPPPVDPDEVQGPDLRQRAKMKAIMEVDEAAIEEATQRQDGSSDDEDLNHQQVSLELFLILETIAVSVSRKSPDGALEPYLDLRLERLGAELWMRPLDKNVNASIGNLQVTHRKYKGLKDRDAPLYLVGSSAESGDDSKPLLDVKLVQADPKHPHFRSDFKSVVTKVGARFEKLEVNLHQEALRDLQEFGLEVSSELGKVTAAKTEDKGTVETAAGGMGRLSRAVSQASVDSVTRMKRKVSSTGSRPRRVKEDTEQVELKAEASLGVIAVVMGTEKSVIADVEMGGLEAVFCQKKSSMGLNLRMTRLQILDPFPETRYPEIMAVEGKEFLQLSFDQWNRSEKERALMGLEDVDMSVQLRMSAVRVVVLGGWLGRVLGWVEPFQAAAANAASQAGEAAQAQAAAAAAKAAETSVKDIPKIRLDLDLKAPVFLVPQNSRSTQVLLADLGRITLKNSFTGLRKDGKMAVQDQLRIELSELKLARVLLEEGSGVKVQSECQLLEPVTFGLDIIRNLSFGWFKERPEVNVKGRVPLIKMSLSQEDYSVVMRISTENLGEMGQAQVGAKPTATKAVQAPPLPKDRQADAGPPATQAVVVPTDAEPKAPKKVPNDASPDRVLFSVHVEGLSASLYMGTSDLGHGTVARNPKHSLGTLAILDFIAKGTMKENGFTGVNVYLVSLTIDDSRPEVKGIKRLMDKKAKTNNVLDLIYSMDEANQKVDIRLRPFFLAICPEFLGALLNFVKVEKEEGDYGGGQSRTPSSAAGVQSGAPAVPSGIPATTPVSPDPPKGTMSVFFALEDPEIIIVEDASKPHETQALFVKLAVEAKYVSGPKGDSVWANMKSLEIYSSFYEERDSAGRFQVMPPASLALMGKLGTEEAKVDVALGEMTIRVSPAVIRLLSSAAAGLGADTSQAPKESQLARKKRLEANLRQWDAEPFKDEDYWFIREVLSAEEAVESRELLGDVLPTPKKKEIAVVKMESLIILLEIGAEEKTIPVILVQTSLSAQAKNWSSQLSLEAGLTFQLATYNTLYSTWEPMIEPVQKKRGDGVMEPWELTLTAQTLSAIDTSDDYEVGQTQPPKMSVRLASEETLELTVSKTTYHMLLSLQEAFSKAAKNVAPPSSKALPGTAPYIVYNYTGIPVQIRNSETLKLEGLEGEEPEESMTLQHDCMAFLWSAAGPESTNSRVRKILAQKRDEATLVVGFESMKTVREVDVSRSELRVFELPVQSQGAGAWKLVVETTSEQGRRIVTLRSVVSVRNLMEVAVEVFFLQDTNLEHSVVVEAGEAAQLPLPAVYSPSGDLFFKPLMEKDEDAYEATAEALTWTAFQDKYSASILRAALSTEPEQGFYVHALGVLEEGCLENSSKHSLTTQCWRVELRSAVSFRNVLPVDVRVTAPFADTLLLKPGQSAPLYSACPDALVEVEVLAQPGKPFASNIKVLDEPPELAYHTFKSAEDETMDLGLRTASHHGGQEIHLYAPFWMINQSGMDLAYKGSSGQGVVEQKADVVGPVLFSFSGKDFFKSKKLQLSIGGAEWSEGIPVDAVGNSGRVTSAFKNGPSYDVSVSSQISYSGLSKVITFTPFFLLDNRCSDAVEVREVLEGEKASWTRVPGEACQGFTSVSKDKRRLMVVRFAGEEEECVAFPFTEKWEALARIRGQRVGVKVAVSISESSVVVVVEEFEEGLSPALLINHSPYKLSFRQAYANAKSSELSPKQRQHFTWESLTEKRQLGWTLAAGAQKEALDELVKDGIGEVEVGPEGKVYWVSFLLGRQRALLFTADIAVVSTAHQAYELERADMEVVLSLDSLGLSLVNNLVGQEILYLGIVSSGIVWEQKKKRFKPMSNKRNAALEAVYKDYLLRKAAGQKPDPVVTVDSQAAVGRERGLLDDASEKSSMSEPSRSLSKTPTHRHCLFRRSHHRDRSKKVNLEEMTMVGSGGGAGRKVRRSFQEGLSIRYRSSAHLSAIHLKLQHLQVDSQTNTAVFRTMLAPVPPPKSIAADAVPKPFTEFSFVKKNQEYSSLQQIKYAKLLVQEFAVKADMGSVNAVLAWSAAEEAQKESGPELMDKDLAMCKVVLKDLSATASATGVKVFYDMLHISPLKIHLSFSQGGSSGGGATGGIQSEALGILLKSVGVTLTEIQDVVFKLAYFEAQHAFLSNEQLQAEITNHYTSQALKQLYVLVLGLDVIGNPFGLIRDLSSGVEDLFYEPFQGAIQGPEEFAEGLALGVKSLFGHALGGAAGAVGRITGTLGKGIAALTMDEEYQKKRAEALNRRPANAREGLAQGGKGLVMGFYDGVTGIVRQPVKGAMEEGFLGFGKGLGKGLVGVVTRPVAGVVDFASSSLDAAQKIADVEVEVKRLRAPRYIAADKILRPYNRLEAEGNLILQGAEKGRYAETDHYVAHVSLENNFFLFLTNHRVMVLSKSDVFGNWDVDWAYGWDELGQEPVLTSKGVRFQLKERKKKFLGLGGSSGGKIVTVQDPKAAQFITRKAQEQYNKASES